MRLNLVHLDDALIRQPRFREACAALGAIEVDLRDAGPEARLWATEKCYEALRSRVAKALATADDSEPVVTWLGSGDFHHVSAALSAEVAKKQSGPITIVAFDNHPDWVAFCGGIHCGSWVRYVLDHRLADRVVVIGVTSRDLSWPELKGAALDHIASGRLVIFPMTQATSIVWGNYSQGIGHTQQGRRLTWNALKSGDLPHGSERVLAAIPAGAIYITIDKDALVEDDAGTNWDQGLLTLPDLLLWLRLLAVRYKVMGIDVTGDYSYPKFKGSALSRLLKHSEILIDHPRVRRSAADMTSVNERTNLTILKTLGEVLC